MGTDPDLLVHPEHVSKQLECAICCLILETPCETSTGHLYCEQCLLEYLARSESDKPLCPVSKAELDPNDIRKPSRIIINMLAELELYCPNKEHGCEWQGQNEHVTMHLASCEKRPAAELIEEIKVKDAKIKQLRARCLKHEDHVKDLKNRNTELMDDLSICKRKLKVYDAFFQSSEGKDVKAGATRQAKGGSSSDVDGESALQKLLRLRDLGSFEDNGK